ncbi:MAG: carbamoyltransferase C-terminal domain-containing protein [Pseudomonadota bacterium]|nr:carbamoyltransferase C-terminal domain-containing protein [Pseudomonadota bacterium]
MIVLGVANSKDSGACLMVDGRLVTAINEERLSRKKLTKEFPYRSIDWILQRHGITIRDVDAIGTGVWKGIDSWRMFPQFLSESLDASGREPAARTAIEERLKSSVQSDLRQSIEMQRGLDKIGASEARLFRCGHHHAHAITAFHFSHYDRALVITLDGRGDFCSGSVSQMSRTAPPNLLRLETEFNSLGVFYGWITRFLGFTPDRHEGKVTGLAAVGDPAKCRHVLRRMIRGDNGRILANVGNNYRPYATAVLPSIEIELRAFSKEDIAAAAQELLEDIVTNYVSYYLKETGESFLCLSGGIFANVLLNMRLKDLPGVEGVFVYPHMGDGGIAAGGAAYATLKLGGDVLPLSSAYLGPDYSVEKCAEQITKYGFSATPVANFAEFVAQDLYDGRIVGFFSGRMEYGPRSLGARSILASATDASINRSLNARLSRTEFMPFAPVTLEEEAEKRYIGWNPDHVNAQFMTSCYECTSLMIDEAPAVVHVDGTARPQIVSSERNGVYYEVLQAYFRKSGIPTLINTSFNRHEEPIICTPSEAIEEFVSGSVDTLAIYPFVLTR